MLSRFSDPPCVFVPSPRLGLVPSQSCLSPTLLYISPIHSSSATANCFILLRPTFFTFDRRFWPFFSRPAPPNPFTLFLNPASSLFDPPPPLVAINFSSSSASHGFSSPGKALSPFSLRSSHWRGRGLNIEAKDGEYSSPSEQSSLQAGRSSRMTRVEEYQKQVCPILANCRFMFRFSSGKLYLFV